MILLCEPTEDFLIPRSCRCDFPGQLRARAKPAVGTDAGVFAHFGAVAVREGKNLRPAAHNRVLEDAIGAHANLVFEHDVTLEHTTDVDFHVAAAGEASADVDAFGIEERHPVFEELMRLRTLPHAFESGELNLGVHALHFIDVARMNGGDRGVFRRGEPDHVRQIVFALGVLVGEVREPALETVGRKHHDARVHLADSLFLNRGILFLHDGRDAPEFVAHDAAVSRRIGKLHRQQNQVLSGSLFLHRGDRFTRKKRHVAEAHQRLRVGGI